MNTKFENMIRRNVHQLIEQGILVPNPQERDCLEIVDDKYEIVYCKEGVVVDNFYLIDNNSVMFCSPCGLEHLYDHEVQRTDDVFGVFEVVRIPV